MEVVKGGSGFLRRSRRFTSGSCEVHIPNGRHDGPGLLLIVQRERFAVDLVEPGLERVLFLLQPGRDGPVLDRIEGLDLVLPLTDQPERHRLNPTGRESGSDRLPQERTDLISDQSIQNSACLLRFDLVEIQGLRGLESTLDGALGDFAEGHPLEAAPVVIEAEVVGNVIGDRLALAIRVGSQDDTLGLLGLALDLLENFPLAADRLVFGLEAVVDVDSEFLLRQVPNVPD